MKTTTNLPQQKPPTNAATAETAIHNTKHQTLTAPLPLRHYRHLINSGGVYIINTATKQTAGPKTKTIN